MIQYLEYKIFKKPSNLFKLNEFNGMYCNVNMSDYLCVHRGRIELKESQSLAVIDNLQLLNDLSNRYNTNPPESFEARNVSIGDIIELNGSAFIYLSLGWKELNK